VRAAPDGEASHDREDLAMLDDAPPKGQGAKTAAL
jgi:hypothetical protein